jgi:hypothetical protein
MWIVQIAIACLFIIGIILLINKLTKGYDSKNKSDPRERLKEVEQFLADARESLSEAEIELLEQERDALRKLEESKHLKQDIEEKKTKL